jgi:hypothetical protein
MYLKNTAAHRTTKAKKLMPAATVRLVHGVHNASIDVGMT